MQKKVDNLPWERRDGESEKAFEAFQIYCDMGENRTFTSVAHRLHKSYTLIRRWKEQWDWEERARIFDNEIEKEAKANAVKRRKEMTERHINIALQMQKKALAALQSLASESMSAKEIREYISMATELERLNRTLEEADGSQNAQSGAQSMADAVIEAYRMRKEGGDA